MTIYSIKPLFQKTLMPVANLMIKLKIHPTLINFAALIISIITGFLFILLNNNKYIILIIPVLLFIRIALNALDGIVARGLKVSSSKGEIYNEFIDRICDIVIFIGLLFLFIDKINLNNTLNIKYQFILGDIFIILFLLNSYIGILSKAVGKNRLYIGFIGKADRMFYLGLSLLLYFIFTINLIWTFFYLFMIAGTIISIGQRLCKAVQ